MNGQKRIRYFVTNQRNQPLELHLKTGVIVLNALGEAEVQEVDLAAPQLRVLRQNRLITTREIVETLPAASEGGRRGKAKAEA